MVKHFVDIDQFKKKQIDGLIKDAKLLKKYPNKFKNYFKDRTLGLLFEKQSLRTRLSFTTGMQKMGGNVIQLNSEDIGLGIRESNKDILKTLSQYVDCLMIRNHDHKTIMLYQSLNYLPIINGLSEYSHPCQILSDLLTIDESIGAIKNKLICWIGDFNNVLRSLIHLQKIYFFNLNVVMPKEIIIKNKKEINFFNSSNLKFTNNINDGVTKSNCIMTDAWVSMGEKDNKKKKYFKNYKVTKDVMKLTNKDAIFMHCLPAHREEEVSSEILDSKKSVIWQQAKNRIYAQQAILKYLVKRK